MRCRLYLVIRDMKHRIDWAYEEQRYYLKS